MSRTTSRRAILAGLAASATVPASIGLANPGAGVASDPLHVEAYRRLLIGYRWHQQGRIVSDTAKYNSVEDRAATAVSWWLWDQANAVLDLPAPQTPVGIAVAAFAMAIMLEGEAAGSRQDPDSHRAVQFVRAVVACLKLSFPAEFPGFGDEPDYWERDAAIMARPGRLPAWALDGRSEPYPSDLMGGAA